MDVSTLEPGRTTLRIPPEFKALLSALQLNKPDTASLKMLADEKWTSLLDFCDNAHLTLQVAQLPMTGFPHWVAERLRTNLADNALRFDRVKATYREAAEALAKAGVAHVVIKGFTQSPNYVEHPRLRSQSDIDIFCPPESIETGLKALQTIGYKPSDAKISYARADHLPTLVRPGSWQWKGNPFDPEMPLGIELHFCLWNERVSHIRIPEIGLFWDRRAMREVDGLSFSCLSPVDHLAHLTLHILRNLFLGDKIVHHVRELAVFLDSHAGDETFWEVWNDSHSPSLQSFEAIAFYYARAWFGCLLHPLAARQIDNLPAIRRSWLQRFSGSAIETMFEKNKDYLWLQLSLLSSRREKWKIFKWTLFPARYAESINSPAVQARNRRPHPSEASHLWQQYIAYLISRSAVHGRAGLATLRRGLRWRLSPDFLTR